jgi:hypothetical protein
MIDIKGDVGKALPASSFFYFKAAPGGNARRKGRKT